MSCITKVTLNDKNIQTRSAQLMNQIINILKAEPCSNNIGVQSIVIAYILYKISQENQIRKKSYQDIIAGKLNISQNNIYAFSEIVTEKIWDSCVKLLDDYSLDDFAAAILLPMKDISYTNYNISETPESLVKLVKRILDCKSNDVIADIGCGMGGFLISTALDVPEAKFEGYDVNIDCKLISSIRTEIIGEHITISLQNAFELVSDGVPVKKFDKIFSNYPFGMGLRNLGVGSKYLDDLSQKYPGLSKATSSDWVFNSLLCDLLNDGGRAVGIMTNGSTWNSIDKAMRKYFVEQGFVEAVVALPERMFSYTGISTSLIILSKGNKKVRLVDASHIYQSGRRQNSLSNENIETICTALVSDTEYSKIVELSDLRENDYTLNLSRYLASELTFENGVAFESVIKRITRGAPCTASQLDNMVSDSITNKQFLMLNNIQDGLINKNLPYLTEIPEQYERYCLKNNNIIISKNGYPYKVAVANIHKGQQILANGNLYIIEVDETKINPYYLKAFLESEQGIRTLKSISVGAVIPNIGVDKLTKINIPLPSMEQQERIAKNCQSILDEIAVSKLKLERALNKIHNVFNEGE